MIVKHNRSGDHANQKKKKQKKIWTGDQVG